MTTMHVASNNQKIWSRAVRKLVILHFKKCLTNVLLFPTLQMIQVRDLICGFDQFVSCSSWEDNQALQAENPSIHFHSEA